MITSRLQLLGPFIAVACSSQLAEPDRSGETRPARTSIQVGPDTLSSSADGCVAGEMRSGSDLRCGSDAGLETGTGRDDDSAMATIPSTPHRRADTRTSVRVGIRQSVSLSIEFAPPPPPAPSVDCSPLILTVVGKRTAAVGEDLPLNALAGALESAELQYEWAGPEELQVTGPDAATFHCEEPGEYELVLRLTSPEACSTELPFSILCEASE